MKIQIILIIPFILLFNLYFQACVSIEEKDTIIENSEKPIGNPKKYYKRGVRLYLRGKYEKAIEALSNAISLDQSNSAAYSWRGDAHSLMGMDKEALDDYNSALNIFPRDAVTLNNRGWHYIKLNECRKAIQDANDALYIKQHPDYFDTRGWAYFYLEEYEKAEEDAKSALERDPYLYYSRALIYRIEVARGNREEALKSLKDYLKKPVRGKYKNDILLLKYLANEISIDDLKNHPEWEDLKVVLYYYK